MNTYIKTNTSQQYAAIRATRTQIRAIHPDAEFVPATPKMRQLARIGAIPTGTIRNGRLAYL